MQFDSFSAFLNMGGYAFYVWLSYGVSALLLIILVVVSNNQNKAVIQRILVRQKREKRLRIAAQQQVEDASSVNQTEDNIKNRNDSNEVSS